MEYEVSEINQYLQELSDSFVDVLESEYAKQLALYPRDRARVMRSFKSASIERLNRFSNLLTSYMSNKAEVPSDVLREAKTSFMLIANSNYELYERKIKTFSIRASRLLNEFDVNKLIIDELAMLSGKGSNSMHFVSSKRY